jgi:hypothetical protein
LYGQADQGKCYGTAGHEDEGGMISRNVGKYLTVDMAELLKRLDSSTML